MHGVIAAVIGGAGGHAQGWYQPSGAEATWMHPLNALMNPLSSVVSRKQKEGASGPRDLMHEMITAIQTKPDGTLYAGMGGKDTRPGDLTAQFDPKMDQDINLYTGGRDEVVIIV
jgi:hypothetical protein